ncbi:MAG: Mur ligase domain-containing protein [bacterium]|nr:Mur ligase domain-containing protein [bacterium]
MQTAPHISPTQKPRYFFINYLSSLALKKEDYFPVAMFSGIPFSNKTRPGRLCKTDGDINLIPSSMQDELVYQSKISEKTIEIFEKLDPKIKKLLPNMKNDMDYTKWALKAVQKIEHNFLYSKPVCFDYNEVAKNYLLLALQDGAHPICQILFNESNLKILEREFKDEVLFYHPHKNGKYIETSSYYLKLGALQSNKYKILLNKENLIKELENNSLCVGLPLGFLIYSFLNDFMCAGSFAQVEYLPKYKNKFMQIPILKEKIKNAPTGVLTTGGFKDDLNLHPLDLHLDPSLKDKVNFKKYEDTLFGEAILAIKDVLLYQNYSGNYQDKKENKNIKNSSKQKSKVHFIGICGKGMSGLAIMLKQKGYVVSGSDEGFYEPVAGLLKKNKIKIYTPHKKENIPLDADFIIIGRHAKLVPETNKEVKMAFASGIPIKSLPEAIGDLIKGKTNTVIAGSFGKSTMTALVSHCLVSAQKDPSYFIGAVPLGFKQNAYLGSGKDFILEGDEYPSANWDNNSKFLYMRPTNAILISGEHDHINVFPTEQEYVKPYEKFVALLPKDGLLVACKNAKNVLKISKKSKSKIVFYDLKDKTSWHAENIIYGTQTTFDLYNKNQKITNLATTLLGKHNIENIIGASSFLLEKKLLNKIELQKAILSFKGVSGRIDLKTKKSSVLIYEGYGSSYAKAKSVFEALNLHYPNKRLITVFEPHTFSWRNHDAKVWYENVFNTSDIVIILPPPIHGASTHAQMSQDNIVQIVKKYRKIVYAPTTEQETLEILKSILNHDDLLALITSGSLYGLTSSIPHLAEKLFPKK